MVGLLTAIVVLAALGLLFAVDPGGAIAESGFPDFQEMDWKQLTAWGFRTIGVVVAQLLIIALWLWPKYRPPQASTRYSGTPPPDSMPAVAVSALEGHAIWSPTMLASIIEMCQRGTLRIEAVGTRVGFLYRLSSQGLTQYAWERTICDSLPSRATTIDELHESIRKHDDAIGDQIGDYLQHRGFFHDNPVRVRRKNSYDGGDWWLLACILTGVGSGLWAALWLDEWWANVLIGAFAGLVYSFFAVQMTMAMTGMLKPTPTGALEISQWLGWKASMAESASPGARSQSDPLLAHAVAFNVAEPWLDVAASAPPWFGPRDESSLPGADLDAAYRAFMHAPEWWLTGRSEDAAKAAAGVGYELELELLDSESPDIEKATHRGADDESEDAAKAAAQHGHEQELALFDLESPDTEKATHRSASDENEEIGWEPESQGGPPAGAQASPLAGYQTYRAEGVVEESKGNERSRGRLRGCFIWLVSLVCVVVVVLVVLFSLDVVSPRDKPCPLNSPPIPTPAQIAVIGDLFRDGCVRVSGTLVSKEADMLVLKIDRGDYVQQVIVRVPAGLFEGTSLGKQLSLGGWFRVEENGTYEVHFVPDRGSDRGWWRNLRENFEGLF